MNIISATQQVYTLTDQSRKEFAKTAHSLIQDAMATTNARGRLGGLTIKMSYEGLTRLFEEYCTKYIQETSTILESYPHEYWKDHEEDIFAFFTGDCDHNQKVITLEFDKAKESLMRGRDPGLSVEETTQRIREIKYVELNLLFRKKEKESKTMPGDIHYNISGSGNRVNIHSKDYSINLENSPIIFRELRDKIAEGIENEEEREIILKSVSELESSVGQKGFVEKYKEFIQTAANHMTIVAPYIPALAEFIK